MSELTDIQLIKEIKEKNDSNALKELIGRHTGIYLDIINRYTYVPVFDKWELIDNKDYNIYQYALAYEENRGMKFSSYIGNRVKYECQDIITHMIEKEEIDEEKLMDDHPVIDENSEFLKIVLDTAKQIPDKRFYSIIEMKFLSKEPATLDEIGKVFGISNERVRQIFEKNLKILRKKLKKQLLEI
jgi:hypothetical protein